ncbi:Alpha/Beta hydrolase protein [Aspergillus varians]
MILMYSWSRKCNTTRPLVLKVLAKIFRTLALTLARMATNDKPTPDLIEYIPATSTLTTTKPNNPPPTPTHKIKTHIYNPSVSTKPTSVLITACGSGFITPGLGLDDPYCHLIATKTSHTVIDVGYRVAPEHPFPAALEDLVSVVNWVLSQPERFDKSRISIGGFSAGANITTSVAVNYFPPRTFWALVAFYPVLDARMGGKVGVRVEQGRPEFGGMGSVPGVVMGFMRDCYLLGSISGKEGESGSGSYGDLLKDPRVSPAFADVDRFPLRCVFISCEYDVLAREAEELAERIKKGDHGVGRKVVVHRVKGCGHAFDKQVKVGSERDRIREEVYGMVVDVLRGF